MVAVEPVILNIPSEVKHDLLDNLLIKNSVINGISLGTDSYCNICSNFTLNNGGTDKKYVHPLQHVKLLTG